MHPWEDTREWHNGAPPKPFLEETALPGPFPPSTSTVASLQLIPSRVDPRLSFSEKWSTLLSFYKPDAEKVARISAAIKAIGTPCQGLNADKIGEVAQTVIDSNVDGPFHLSPSDGRVHSYIRLADKSVVVLTDQSLGQGYTKTARFALRIFEDGRVVPCTSIQMRPERIAEWSKNTDYYAQRVSDLVSEMRRNGTSGLKGFVDPIPGECMLEVDREPLFIAPYYPGTLYTYDYNRDTVHCDVLHCLIDAGGNLLKALERGFVHRDIKPENIFVEGGERWVTKIGDLESLDAVADVMNNSNRHVSKTYRQFALGAIWEGSSVDSPPLLAQVVEELGGIPAEIKVALEKLLEGELPKHVELVKGFEVKADLTNDAFLDALKARGSGMYTLLTLYLEQERSLDDLYTAALCHSFPELRAWMGRGKEFPPTSVLGANLQRYFSGFTAATPVDPYYKGLAAKLMTISRELDCVLVGTPGYHPLKECQTRVATAEGDVYAFAKTVAGFPEFLLKKGYPPLPKPVERELLRRVHKLAGSADEGAPVARLQELLEYLTSLVSGGLDARHEATSAGIPAISGVVA